MRRVNIIGCPGAGKSTFARKLSEKTGLELFYLDMIWHKPDKTTVARNEFDLRLNKIFERDTWIIDGNYMRTMETRMTKADVIFLFDLPTDICIDGVCERIGKTHEDLPWIETETDNDFINFIKNFRTESLPKIYELTEKYSNIKTVVFKSRQDAEEYLQAIKKDTQKE